MADREDVKCPHCGNTVNMSMPLNYTAVTTVKTHRDAIDWIEKKTGSKPWGQPKWDKGSEYCFECSSDFHYVQKKTDL